GGGGGGGGGQRAGGGGDGGCVVSAGDRPAEKQATQHGNQRAGKEGGTRHGERLRVCERMEELALLTRECEHRDEREDDDRHRKEDRPADETSRGQDGLSHPAPVVRVDTLPLHETERVLRDDDRGVDE